VHAGGGGGDRLHVVHALRGFQDGVDQNRLPQAMPCLELRQKLIEVMNVPGAFDLRQHDDVEFGPDRAHDLNDVIERPGGVQRIDARPQARRAEFRRPRHLDETRARRRLGVDRDRVFKIAEHHVDLPDEVRHLRAHLLDVRRHEMDHALEPHRQFAQRVRRADCEWGVEGAGVLHGGGSFHRAGQPFRGMLRPRQAVARSRRERPSGVSPSK
jgi:hypothetical protein